MTNDRAQGVVGESVDHGADAAVHEIVGGLADVIAEQQEAEQVQRDFAVSFRNAPIGMSLASMEGKLLRVNPALCRMLGYSEDELLAMNWRDFTHPDDIQVNEQEGERVRAARVKADAVTGQVEKRYIRADGSIIWVLVTLAAARDDDGIPIYSVAYMQDITARKQAEASLNRAVDLFQAVFDHAPIGMALIAADGGVERSNDALLQMLGLAPGAAADGMSLERIMHPEDAAATIEALRTDAGDEGQWRSKVRFRAAGGQELTGLLSASRVRAVDDPAPYFILQIVDTSELHNANQKLRWLLKSRDELIASVSHELRTPLTGVLGFAEVLRDPGGNLTPTESPEMIRTIANQSKDLSNIVEDLLAAARAETDSLRVAQVPVNLRAQAAQVIEALEPEAAAFVTLGGDWHKATGDPARVRQILRNLITNALMYGGSEIRVDVESDGSMATIAVRDNGAGVAAADEERIFESFQRAQVDDGLTAGVGLGLAVSRKLARLMGGDLAYGREGDDTVFRLTLPARGSG